MINNIANDSTPQNPSVAELNLPLTDDSGTDGETINRQLQDYINQIQDLIPELQKHPKDPILKKHIASVMQTICDFLNEHGYDIEKECKRNGWSDTGDQNYTHFIFAAMQQLANFTDPDCTDPLVPLEQFNTYLTQVHFFATTRNPHAG